MRGNPEKTKPFRWPKGVSGNPGGRPKRNAMTDAYRKLADQICPHDKKRRIWSEVVAEAQFKVASKGGTIAAREIADRVEGKVSSRVLADQDVDRGAVGPDSGHISLPAGLSVDERIIELTRLIRERIERRKLAQSDGLAVVQYGEGTDFDQ